MPNVISLYSGAGGCSLGLKQSNYNICLAIDNAIDACATYSKNISEKIVCGDLNSLDVKDVCRINAIDPNSIDLIVGGPPCQGFSSAGTKSWDDPRNPQVKKFVDITCELKPTWFIMENVEGLLTSFGGFYFVEAISRFLNAGYWVRAEKIYMEKYGVPQRRKRVFVVGNLEQYAFNFPPYTHRERYQQTITGDSPQVSILDAIEDLPDPTKSGHIKYCRDPENDFQSLVRRQDGKLVHLHKMKSVNGIIMKRIKHLAQGQSMKDLPQELHHNSFKKRKYRRVKDGTPTEKRGGPPAGIKRLVGDLPSLTITTGSISEFVHPIHNRPLTLRECARIQTFPDWFDFVGSDNSVITQIANAIPPLYMRTLGEYIESHASWKKDAQSRGHWLGIKATKAEAMSPALSKMLNELEEKVIAFA